jgi:hypothetical protein
MCSEHACIRATQLWIATTHDTVTALQVSNRKQFRLRDARSDVQTADLWEGDNGTR